MDDLGHGPHHDGRVVRWRPTSWPAAGDRLEGSGAVALGVGVGHYLDHVPAAMIDKAQALRIPLFEAPLSVPFRTIVTYVFDALASSDMHRMRRSLAVQSHLLDLLIEERSVSDLIASLSAILGIPVVLFDAWGNVVAPAGGGAQPDEIARTLWGEYARVEGAVGPLGVLESGHDRLYYHKVCLHGVVERVLAAKGATSPGFGARGYGAVVRSPPPRPRLASLARGTSAVRVLSHSAPAP